MAAKPMGCGAVWVMRGMGYVYDVRLYLLSLPIFFSPIGSWLHVALLGNCM